MTDTQGTAAQVRYEEPAPHVARIVMARPEAHNAQGLQMTYELNAAFDQASHNDEIKVIILAADGRNFSSGHDLSGDGGKTWRDFQTVGTWGAFDAKGAEARYGREMESTLAFAASSSSITHGSSASAKQRNCCSRRMKSALATLPRTAWSIGSFRARN
jgi:enoyl-CoA hydratase/carnithine racemase